MNYLFRILVGIYSFLSAVLCGLIMISPFGDKVIMSMVLDYVSVTFYQSNRYDVMLFVIGLVFFGLSIVILTSGIKGKRSARYLCTVTDAGEIKVSAAAIENVALALSKRFQGVKDAKARVQFRREQAEISVKLSVLPDVHVPTLCKNVQDRIKESVETSMDLVVREVCVSVDNIHTATPN